MQALEVIQEGSKGIAVIKWQQFLIQKGLLHSKADGLFGPLTKDATLAFQQSHNLLSNGVVGNFTYAAAVADGLLIALDIASFQGIDVYHGDGLIEWDKVVSNPNLTIGFAYIKATQGTTFTDDAYKANRKHALLNGLRTGSYHFFEVDEPADKQADHFISVVNSLSFGEIAPALDFEPTSLNKANISKVVDGLHVFLSKVWSAFGISPLIYTNHNSWVNVLGNPIEFNNYRLWLAEYAPSFPKLFGGWTEWALWQYTEKGFVRGVPGNSTDLNKYNQNSQLL